MIGLLDPALFLPRSETEVRSDFDTILRMCTKHFVSVPTLDEYWNDLWTQFGSPLERSLSAQGRRTLQQVRRLGAESRILVPPLNPRAGSVWIRGYQQLFGSQYLTTSWEERMAAASIRAAATREKVILFTRRISGRNLVRYMAGSSTLDETTRWVLHLQPTGIGPVQILCVHHPRNLIENWTSRFDWRLPGAQGAHYPFCPPNSWWKGSTQAWRTVSSKPAWIDRHDNGWARPNIPNGAGYHWDVFIQSVSLQEAVGLNQINVVGFDAPPKEGMPGHIHHIPGAKAGKISDVGWTC